MDETKALLIGSIQDRRALAVAMVEALKADAFDRPADPKDITEWEAQIAECDVELAELRSGSAGEKPE